MSILIARLIACKRFFLTQLIVVNGMAMRQIYGNRNDAADRESKAEY
jgi:hypothetical protein